MPGFGATSADIVLHVDSGTLRDPQRATAIRAMLDEVRRQPDVSAVGDPLAEIESADAAISPDGRTAIVTVRYSADIRDLTAQVYHRLNAAAQPVRGEGVAVEHRGIIIERAFEPDSGEAELIGLGVALLVLLTAFGSVVAAGLPILVAMIGLTAGTGLVLLVGSVADVPTAAPLIAVMPGLGAGIDYALPATLTGGGRAYVGGQTAFMIDAADAVAVRLPWVIAGVVLAAGLLLFAMFRAPLVAVKATV